MTIDTPLEFASKVSERMSIQGATLLDVVTVKDQQSMKFEIASIAFVGLRTLLRDTTGGMAVVVSEFKEMRRAVKRPPRTRKAVLISNQLGKANATDLTRAARWGTLFLEGGEDVYEGMIFGESYKDVDIDTNISHVYRPIAGQGKTEKGVGSWPVREMKLEQAITFIQDDEKVEVTPKRVVMRKAFLNPAERKAAARKAIRV